MPSGWYYRPGDYYQIDDLSGFKIRASRSKKIPGGQTGGLIVAPERWESQQPQDFVRGVIDNQSVPEPRPRQKDYYTVVSSFVTTYSPRRDDHVIVRSVEGFALLDWISVMMDNGENHFATIVGIDFHLKRLRITPVLPDTVGGNALGSPIENTVLVLGPSTYDPFLTEDDATPITDEDGNLFSTNI